MRWLSLAALLASAAVAPPPPGTALDQNGEKAARLARRYVEAVAKLNEDHARRPGDVREDELRDELPRGATAALAELLGREGSEEVLAALQQVGEAALDLDRLEDFDAARARLAELAPGSEAELGVALSRERYLLRGLGGLDEAYLATFAQVLDAVLDGYEEVFGFAELSKVPGKKLRVRVHLEPTITRPPHFAPEPPWHTEIDFPVVDPKYFLSPTQDGKFLFYGLCHELGHAVAMWGRPDYEEDHHAWAHFTGVVITEHVTAKGLPALARVQDQRWRSMRKLREEVGGAAPGDETRAQVLALFLALYDELGARTLGAAINWLDARDRRLRVQRVRYYTLDELEKGLLAVVDRSQRKRVKVLMKR